ncbi:MAG: MupG family TIM beta-alpha barrel fold protein [Tetragenococcus koreensis]|nr:MupG family TIM beta-alpha barrel fold protein [Tetragenococcus koreensis]MDN6748916.1 MupG family TIM beta-alpha barrel fold protein [Staphylococcus equorum]MDN6146190.1 MupG family TIM beta-alpha barrel fold protein [Tetragenococcus koreensis]MDN6266635.1 MupG family TIM beta-alpha barrel fold protein [Tetragenococcus koreensis]MDN6579667.1 MupG family TIM beta-alpha barrel fold protein [Tetragenococcus koreensis]
MLGISFYPNKESVNDIKEYLDKSYSYGYRYAFTSLLMAGDDVKETIKPFKETVDYATKKGFYVVLDVNPSLFEELNISYSDLSFFKDIGASAIRLDSNFDGLNESLISFDPSNIDLVLNISNDTGNIGNIYSYEPNKKHLTGCHNFYPQPYTGLDLEYFLTCSKKYKQMGMRTGAFINSQVGKDGPHEFNMGLPTLEMHREMDIVTQAKHFIATGLIDDIVIGNAFASDEELRQVAKINQDQVEFSIDINDEMNETEKFVLASQHFNRGDINSYSIRSTFVKLQVKDQTIPPRNTVDVLYPGDVTIGNDRFGQYKGELNIVKKEMRNINHYKNVVGKITKENQFLIGYITPWKKFIFEEVE